jgi:hypothetical protein
MYAMSEHRNERASFCPEKINKLRRKSIQEKPQCADKAENPNIELLYAMQRICNKLCKQGPVSRSSFSNSFGHIRDIDTLQTVTALCLLSHNVENRVNQLRAFCVVTLGPVVSGSSLSKHEVIGPEDLAVWPRPHTIHGSRLQVHEYCTRHISPTACLIVIHIDALELQVRDTLVRSCGIDTMLFAYYLPKLGTDLVPALSSLDVQYFTHLDPFGKRKKRKKDAPKSSRTSKPQTSEKQTTKGKQKQAQKEKRKRGLARERRSERT